MCYRIIIPAYNAAPFLDELTTRIRRAAPDAEILVVDDGSTDETPAVLRRLQVPFIRHTVNRGKGEALKTGFREVLRKPVPAVIQMDADLQHEPESLPDFVATFTSGDYDMLIGARDFRGAMPWPRRMSNHMTSWAISRLLRRSVPDSQSGYRMIARRVLENIHPRTTGFDFESEFLILAGKAGYSIGSVPIRTVYRNGPSAIRPWRDTVRFLKLVGLSWKD